MQIPSPTLLFHYTTIIGSNIVFLMTCLFLYLSHFTGSCFIRTDQLDGETDWKLRVAAAPLQQLQEDEVPVCVRACARVCVCVCVCAVCVYVGMNVYVYTCVHLVDVFVQVQNHYNSICMYIYTISTYRICLNVTSVFLQRSLIRISTTSWGGYPWYLHVLVYSIRVHMCVCRQLDVCCLQEDEHEEMMEEPLSVENTLWANTVLASGVCVCVCVCVCTYVHVCLYL